MLTNKGLNAAGNVNSFLTLFYFLITAFHVKRSRQTTGKVIIKTNSKISPRLEIPYQVNILQG